MYEVGDKVRVKRGLVIDDIYNTYFFTEDMNDYSGKEATIKEAVRDHDGTSFYNLDIDGGKWNWSDGMLESAEPLSLLQSELAIVVRNGKTHVIMNGVEIKRIKHIKFEQNGGENAEITITADIKKGE